MTKKERQSRITWQIGYGMNKILKAESDYWAERDFEYFIGMLAAYRSIGEITESWYEDLRNHALYILTEVRVSASNE